MNNLRKDIFMLNKNSIQPLYKQLMDIITQQIKNGTYKPGEKIPPEPELADLYHVSRIPKSPGIRSTNAITSISPRTVLPIHRKNIFIPVFCSTYDI